MEKESPQIAESSSIDNIRSDEVQEILAHVPNWMIRWGITLIFGLIMMLLFISWFIKYPDIIKGPVTLTTEIPAVKLVSKTNGQLQRIYIKNGSNVNEGDFIAEIENPMSETSVSYLKTLIQQSEKLLNEASLINNNSSNKDINPISFIDSSFVFGEMQETYNQFKKRVTEYITLLHETYQVNKIKNLKLQIDYYSKLSTVNQRQINLVEKNLKNSKEKYLANKVLYDDELISKMDFFNEETQLMQSKMEVENLKKIYLQNNITLTEYRKQLNDIEYEYSKQERTLKEGIQASIHHINNYINSWQQNYVLIAPFSGKLSYLLNLSENQFIPSGLALFVIIPENNQYIGQIQIASHGFGKVKIGQQTHIKLDNYPYHEFGQIRGEVSEITLVPNINQNNNQATYLVKVKLTNGFKTSYNKLVAFNPEMTGSAEIITEDLRLIERVFSQFRKIFDK